MIRLPKTYSGTTTTLRVCSSPATITTSHIGRKTICGAARRIPLSAFSLAQQRQAQHGNSIYRTYKTASASTYPLTHSASQPIPISGRTAMSKRLSSTSGKRGEEQPKSTDTDRHGHAHEHDKADGKAGHKHSHGSGCDHDHEHSGLFHSHAHDHSEGAEQIMKAWSAGKLDRGTRITLLGLGSNVALTISKGAAGIWMNSASLLAEAGHSLSDLLGDFVTLATWRISRRPPTDAFPWGYGKFETFGTLSVSVILVGGAIGIGLHSYHLLLQTLLPFLESYPPNSLPALIGQLLPHGVPSPLLELFHSHGPSAHEHVHDALEAGSHAHAHSHSHAAGAGAILNPHAAWFALASVAVKEWLYRLTARVAASENSPVLKANALHHRADALTSLVALISILGSSIGGYTFLDPVGGLVVSFFILQQGLSLSKTAFLELLDAGIDARTQTAYEGIIGELVNGYDLLGVRNVRGVKSGGQTVLDCTIDVPRSMTVVASHAVEYRVRDAIMTARREVREVKIHVHAVDEDAERVSEEDGEGDGARGGEEGAKGKGKVIKSDFGQDGCRVEP